MKSISKLGLKGKMVFGILMFIVINAGISAFSVNGLTKVTTTYDHVATINLPNAESLGSMLNDQKDIVTYVQEIVTLPETSTERADGLKKLQEAVAGYEKTDKWYQDIPFVEGEDALYKPVAANWKTFKAEVDSILSKKGSDEKETAAALARMIAASEKLDDTLGKLVSFQSNQAKTWRDNANTVAKTTFNMQVMMVLASAVVSLLAGLWFARSLTNQLNRVVDSISDSSRQVGTAADQIAISSQQLSQATTEQAASLQETSAAIEETSAMVNKNSDNAKSAANNSTECQIKAEQGKVVVEKMIQSMDEINTSNNNIMEQINTSNNQIAEIVKVIQEIGTKTKVINEIVFQTKLLSFNASVEAARAGENGKGFAVVAEEVGNLAQMSGNAAKEITELLDGSIQKVESIVQDTKSKVESLVSDGRQKVEAGIDIAKQCGDVLSEIVHNVALVSNMAGEISSACQDQAQGVQEITKAVNQLDQTTQINASNSEETANAADQLSSQTNSLNRAISALVETIQGVGSVRDFDNSNHQTEQRHAPTQKPVVAKNAVTPSNVIPMKKFDKKSSGKKAESSTPPTRDAMHLNTTPFKSTKTVVDDGTAPSSSHPGFKEV